MTFRALILAAILCVAAVLSTRVRIDDDLGALVPDDGDLRAAMDVLRTFPASDVLLFEVDASGEPAELKGAVDRLATALRAIEGIERVDAGFGMVEGALIGERLAAHAAAFVPPAQLAERTSEAGIRAALETQLARMAGPGGALLEGRILRDPLDLETLAAEQLKAGLRPGLQLRDGLVVDAEGTRALVLVRARPPVNPVDDPMVRGIEAAIAAQPVPTRWYGGARFASETARGIHRDIAVTSALGMLALIGVLGLGYRSWRPVAGAAVPLVVAAATTTVGAWLASPFHPIQLAFSGALAGMSVDYWIHLYVATAERPGQVDRESRFQAAKDELRVLWPALAVSAGSTAMAFGILATSGFPVIRVLGVTGALATTGAFVATVVGGPVVWAWIGRPVAPEPARTPPAWAAALVTLACLALASRAWDNRFEADPMALLARGPDLVETQRELALRFGISDTRALVVLRDADPDRLLDRTARVEEALAATGLATPVGPAAVLPGPATRALRKAALPPADVLQARIDAAADTVGFTGFPEAAARIHAAVDAPVPADLWDGTSLQDRVAANLRPGAALVTLPLPADDAIPYLADTVAGVDPDAAWLVPTRLGADQVLRARDALARGGILGLGALFLALAVRYRSPTTAAAALLPAVASMVCAAGGLTWAGQPWNLVNGTVMVLVLGLAVDYGVFIVESSAPERRRAAGLAIWLSSATTIAGIAPLLLATNPALRSVAVVMLVGMATATTTAMLVVPHLLEGWPGPRVKAVLSRVAWLVVVAVHLDVLLILVTAFTPPPVAIPADGGRGRLVRTAGLWVLAVEGSPSEVGYAAGRLTAPLRPRMEDEMFASFERIVPVRAFRWLITRGSAVVGSGLQAHVLPEHQEEIAAGALAVPELRWLSGPIFTRKVYYHAIHDLGQALVDSPLLGCTGFMAGPPATDGRWLLARSFDFEGGVAFDRDKIVTIHRPDVGIPFLSVGFTGMVGAVSGVNEAGIAVAINAGGSDAPPRPGTPMTLIVREILQTARTLDDADRILRARSGFVSENVMVVDADGGRAALFEVAPDRVARTPVDGWMAVSNHFRAPEFAGDATNARRIAEATTAPRLARMEELVARAVPVDPLEATEILRDRRGVGDVVLARGHRASVNADIATHGVVIDATNRTVLVSRYPNLAGGFAQISLAGNLEATSVVAAEPDAARALDLRLGRELLREARRSDPATASILVDRARALMPGHPEALFEAGRLRFDAGDMAGARPLLEAARAAQPEYLHQRQAIDRMLAP